MAYQLVSDPTQRRASWSKVLRLVGNDSSCLGADMSQKMVPNGQGGSIQPYQGQRAAEPEGQPHDDGAMEDNVYFVQNIRNNLANAYVDQDPSNVDNLRREVGEFAQV